MQVWRTIDFLVDRNSDNDTTRVMRVINITLDHISGDPTARRVVEFWCGWIMGFAPVGGWCGPAGTAIASTPTALGRAALEFFTQIKAGVTADRNIWPADDAPIPRNNLRTNGNGFDWNTRLRGLVALILWSPNFMQR